MRLRMFAACVLLTGCVNPLAVMRAAEVTYVGQDIHSVIKRIGYPKTQAVIAGDTVYTWSSSRQEALTLPTTQITNGQVNGNNFTATTTTEETTYYQSSCELQVATDGVGIIKVLHWSAYSGGCFRYAIVLSR